jgi:formate transporter
MTDQKNNVNLDSLLPLEMAIKAESVGVAKANLGPRQMIGLGVLAGGFIGMGAIFATVVATGTSALPYGVSRLLVGFVFSLGLILVIIGGSELFTGNNLIVMAWASRKITTAKLLRNWVLVYIGNFVGSIITALLVFASGQYLFNGGQVGLTALNIANGKMNFGFFQAIALGILCNALVCLAVWMTMSGRTVTDKIMAIIFPITAFVAAGFEHSVANMFFIPIGLFIKQWGGSAFWGDIGKTSGDYANLTWGNFFLNNLLPVTIGNIIGGTVFVGATYWFLLLRKRK